MRSAIRSRLRSFLAVALATVALGAVWLAPHPAQATIDDLKKKGKVVIGVKPDYKPWGFIGPDGKIIGMEADLAADLAKRIGVELEIVPARSADRLDLLKAGRIDVLIATMSDTPERRQIAGLLLPHYYSSGTNILANTRFGFKQWADLKGRKVCGREGAFYNRSVAVRYRAEIVVFKNNQEAKKALRDGRCAAWLSDDTTIIAELRDKAIWESYEMPLPTEDVTPWSIAVPLEEKASDLAQLIVATIGDWHRSGYLLEVEEKWAARPSEFLQHLHAVWSKKTPSGEWLCKPAVSGAVPPECNSLTPQ